MNDQCQLMNQYQMLHSETVSQPAMVSRMNPPQMISQPSMLNQLMMNLPHQPHSMPPTNNLKPNYGGVKQGRGKWKGRKEMGIRAGGLNEVEHQNRPWRFHQKKFNRMAPYAHAPRNTTSYLIRAKKEGGIASLVSPCPVTPAVLPTPNFSPSREALVEMAKEEWGVDGYGSMKGLIRLRSSPGQEAQQVDDEEEGDSSESDVEEHLGVERRLDHDLSRFEMVYPTIGLGNRVDDQDTHISQLEEENLSLKGRLCLMERELGDIKRRMQCLERQKS